MKQPRRAFREQARDRADRGRAVSRAAAIALRISALLIFLLAAALLFAADGG